MSLRVISGGRGEADLPGLLVVGAAEVVTMAGGPRAGADQGEIDRREAAEVGGRFTPDAPVIAIWEGRILGVGGRADVDRLIAGEGYPLSRFDRLDAAGGTVTPGLIDPHTHLLFAGSREGELELRQEGASYLDILAAGGGILSTVAATREASADDLAAHGRRWLDEMLGHGVTTVEAKSGYGLDLSTELRLLEVAHRLGVEGPIEVVPTWLGAHAVPPEMRNRPDATEAFVGSLIDEQLPGVAAQGRAVAADVFCEQGVFTADQSRRILTAAARLGLRPRLHADELAPSGGAELAAEIGATTADHLATPSEAGIAELADLLNQRATECRAHKLTVGYHSHGFDFEKINGQFAWELLFSRTDPAVNMQLDVGNCLDGKGDPIAMLKKFPGRTRSIHIKEHEDKTFGSDFYKEIFRLCETSSGTKWYIVEMGGPDGNGFDVPRDALEKLHRLGK